MNQNNINGNFSRRQILTASTLGLAGFRFGNPQLAASQDPVLTNAITTGGKAKSTILFFLCGGSSHIDMWDLKPDAPDQYRGEFKPKLPASRSASIFRDWPALGIIWLWSARSVRQ